MGKTWILLKNETEVKNRQYCQELFAVTYFYLNNYCMRYLLILSLVVTALVLISYTTEKKIETCKDIQKGEFYFYPKGSDKKYKIVRNAKFQREINLVSGDTSVYKINWINDCNCDLDYVSGKAKVTDNVRQHKIYMQILNFNNNYYESRVCLDSMSSPYCLTDTVWLHPR